MSLHAMQQELLDKPFIVDLILSGRLSLKVVIRLDFAQRLALESPEIQALMQQGIL